MKLLELFEQAGKTAAVAFGRMNPPTIGHQKVVDAVLKIGKPTTI
jgi:nicotinamide mononucleotide adenylyltransferase